MIARAAVGQVWDAPSRTLSLSPAILSGGGGSSSFEKQRLAFFAGGAAGVLAVGKPGEKHTLEVHVGVLEDVTVSVEVRGERWTAAVGRAAAGATVPLTISKD